MISSECTGLDMLIGQMDLDPKTKFYLDKQIEYCQKQIKLDRPYASQLFFTYYDLAAIYALRGEREKAYKNLLIFNRGKRYHLAWDSLLIV